MFGRKIVMSRFQFYPKEGGNVQRALFVLIHNDSAVLRLSFAETCCKHRGDLLVRFPPRPVVEFTLLYEVVDGMQVLQTIPR